MPLTTIKQQLMSRIELSNKLIDFMDKAEQKLVSKEEIDAFCMDLFKQKVSSYLLLFSVFKKALNGAIKTYERLLHLCEGKNKPITISILDLSLESEILLDKQYTQSSEMAVPQFFKSNRFLHEEADFFQLLREMLKPYWPEPYIFFRKYFSFQLINSDYKKFKNHKQQMKTYHVNAVVTEEKHKRVSYKLAFNSNGLNVEEVLDSFYQKDLGDNPQSMQIELIELISIYKTTVLAAAENIKKVKAIVVSDVDTVPFLINNAFDFYHSLCDLKNRAQEAFQSINYLVEQQHLLSKLKNCVNKFKSKFERMALDYDNKKQEWVSILKNAEKFQNETLDFTFKKIMLSEVLLDKLLAEVKDEFVVVTGEDNTLTGEYVNAFNMKLKNKLNNIKKIINQYQQSQTAYKELADILTRQMLLQEMLKKQKDKQVFIEQKQAQLFLWNKKVEEAKKAKAATAINPLCTSVKPVTQLENPSHEALLKIAESLKHLSTRKIALLKAIFNGEKGITYHQVYYLLTNKLKAKIVEHGGGSSHKTIIMNNYATCLMTNSQLPQIIKSGALKPHEGSHQSGELSGFNLELIQTVLIKGGITPEVIDLLEEQKLQQGMSQLKMKL